MLSVGARTPSPPPRFSRTCCRRGLPALSGADVAGGVLPGYDVGGDFFDYAGNADGLWLVVADATGKGNSAAALSSLAIGALRAARRAGAGLQEAARLADEAILALDMQLYLTAVMGSWDPMRIGCAGSTAAIRRRWSCAPMGESTSSTASAPIRSASGSRAQVPGAQRPGRPWDRLLLYSDGVSERRTADGGRVGEDGLHGSLLAGSPLGSDDCAPPAGRRPKGFPGAVARRRDAAGRRPPQA